MTKRKNPLGWIILAILIVGVVAWQSGYVFLGGGPDLTCTNPHYAIRNGVRVIEGYNQVMMKTRVCDWNAFDNNRYCVYCDDDDPGGYQYIKSEDRDVTLGKVWSTMDSCFIADEDREYVASQTQGQILVEQWHRILQTYPFNSIISDFNMQIIQPGIRERGVEYDSHNEGDVVFDSITNKNYVCNAEETRPGVGGDGWVEVTTTTTIPGTSTTTIPPCPEGQTRDENGVCQPGGRIPSELIILTVLVVGLGAIYMKGRRRK